MKHFLKCMLIIILAIFIMNIFAGTARAAQTTTPCLSQDTESGDVLEDTDCDVMPNIADNCPAVPNPKQEDTDHDGIGDSCESIPVKQTPEPQVTRPSLTDPPKTTGRESTSPAGLDLDITFTNDATLIRGGIPEFYTIKITNTGPNPAAVELRLSDISQWGQYAIKPRTVIVEAGETAKAFIQVSALTDAPLGEKRFTATISADGTEKDLTIYATVIGRDIMKDMSKPTLELVFLGIILIVLAIGVAAGLRRRG